MQACWGLGMSYFPPQAKVFPFIICFEGGYLTGQNRVTVTEESHYSEMAYIKWEKD
jgi:hypothetical protein